MLKHFLPNHMKNDKTKNSHFKESKKLALHYMKTLVDVARESFLILDSKLRVLSANPTFYKSFRVTLKQTENKHIYELGNGQWNTPELKKLLEEILPKEKTVNNYEVMHVFEKIGEKTMLLNAGQIDSVQLIILAIEDISLRKELEKKLSEYAQKLEVKVFERTKQLVDQVKELEILNRTMVGRELKMVELKEEIENLKNQVKNGNGKNGYKNSLKK